MHRRGQTIEPAAYRRFLEEIGYILPEGADFSISPDNVDDEIALMAGPQLVVPVMNARFALNAANARWGSLYDALYGTDAISLDGDLAPGSGYNAARGAAVITRAAEQLDAMVPLDGARHADVTGYEAGVDGLVATVDGRAVGLVNPAQYRGKRVTAGQTAYLLVHNGLHVELLIDPAHPIGAISTSGLTSSRPRKGARSQNVIMSLLKVGERDEVARWSEPAFERCTAHGALVHAAGDDEAAANTGQGCSDIHRGWSGRIAFSGLAPTELRHF